MANRASVSSRCCCRSWTAPCSPAAPDRPLSPGLLRPTHRISKEAIPLATPFQLRRMETDNAHEPTAAPPRPRRERTPLPPPSIYRGWYRPVKHALDFAAVLVIGVLALPVIAASALIVKL